MKKLIIHAPSFPAVILGVLVFGCVFSNSIIDSFFSAISSLQLLGRCLMISLLMLYCLLKKRKLSNTTLLLSVMLLWILISTLIGGWNIVGAISKLSGMYLVCITLDTVSYSDRKLLTVLDTWKWIIFLLILLDLGTELLFPNGMYSTSLYSLNWFLGYKTERIVYSLPMIIMFAVSAIKKHGKITISFYIVTMISAINTILSQAGAGSAMYIVIILIVYLIDLNSHGKIKFIKKPLEFFMDYRLVISLYSIIVICLVMLQNLEFVSEISESLGKGDGLSGRDTIWKACMTEFKENPIRGKGFMSSIDYVNLVGMEAASNAHNMVLTILLSGGVVALLLYVLIFINAYRKKDVVMTHHYIIAIFIFAMMMLGITSSTFVFSTFSMLGFWLMENLKNERLKQRMLRKIKFEFF